MCFAMLVFWALVAFVVVAVVRQSRRADQARTARDVLDERYARGDIEDDEYSRRSELIRH